MANARRKFKSHKLQITIDHATDAVIQEMIPLGIHGRSQSEVAAWIIRNWIWDNQEKLRINGIDLSKMKATDRE